MKKVKSIPRFRSEDEEREFWATHDSTEYFDWSRAVRVVFPNLQPSTRTISLRLPESLLADLKVLASRLDVPYQSLMKVYLAERVMRELTQGRTPEELAAEVREPAAPYGRGGKPRKRSSVGSRPRRGKKA
ncbi:MAG TPA: BrnA antitoxin family protein [Thermoanaerobaculia bacterium]